MKDAFVMIGKRNSVQIKLENSIYKMITFYWPTCKLCPLFTKLIPFIPTTANPFPPRTPSSLHPLSCPPPLSSLVSSPVYYPPWTPSSIPLFILFSPRSPSFSHSYVNIIILLLQICSVRSFTIFCCLSSQSVHIQPKNLNKWVVNNILY